MDKRVRAALAILERDYLRRVDYSAVAASLGLGLSRLEHLFKRDIHKPMRLYVRDLRILEAARLLSTTRMRIGEIGAAIGLPDAANFNHLFKERFGVSPRTYRIDAVLGRMGPNRAAADQIEQQKPRDHN